MLTYSPISWHSPHDGSDPDPVATIRELPLPGASLSEVVAALECPTVAVVDGALAAGVDLVVTHHPLLLTPVHGVPADDIKGRLVHRLIRAGIGLFTAHTNADRAADHRVNDALAAALGLVGPVPLETVPAPDTDTLVVFAPVAHADRLVDVLAAAGAGVIGDYTRCV